MSEFIYRGICKKCQVVREFLGGWNRAVCECCGKEQATEDLKLIYSEDDDLRGDEDE